MTNANDSINNSEQGPQDGLTKREYFAAMAMQGMASSWHNNDQDRQEVAKRSVKLADALITALNQTK